VSRVLAVSPHLDDAVFSAGARLAEHAMAGDAVMVVTCFTGNVAEPQGFVLACQLDKGLPADIDYMALRRAEDEAACALIGAEPLHLPLLEAPHRGYDSAVALFGPRLASDTMLSRARHSVERGRRRLPTRSRLWPLWRRQPCRPPPGARSDGVRVREYAGDLVGGLPLCHARTGRADEHHTISGER
jgi:hypothetical protein